MDITFLLSCFVLLQQEKCNIGSFNLMKRVSKFDMDKQYKKIQIFRLDLALTLTGVFPKSACKVHFVANDFVKRRESEYSVAFGSTQQLHFLISIDTHEN